MAQFGMVGLGVMGQNLALNIEEHGFSVAVWNLEPEWTERFIAGHKGKRFSPAKTLAELTRSLDRPRRIMIMIKAGKATDAVIGDLAPLLHAGDVVIDGTEGVDRHPVALHDLPRQAHQPLGVGGSLADYVEPRPEPWRR